MIEFDMETVGNRIFRDINRRKKETKKENNEKLDFWES